MLHMSTTSVPSSISAISAQVKDVRAMISQDERASMMIDALRGKNLNDDDRQGDGIDMKIVQTRESIDDNDVLPTVYNPVALERYFNQRPGAVATRVWQILSSSSSFFLTILGDAITGQLKDLEVKRAAELRNTIVSLGPFFIKLGQALSIRPDILSPRAMVELQQLCDKVPSFDSKLAMKTIQEELGKPIDVLFSQITDEPVAAASLGQVYKATLRSNGEEVAVKVQRPYVLETVSLDLYLVRRLGMFARNFPSISNRLDIVSLLDEFAGNFYQELDYNLECANGCKIAEDMKKLPMVVIPRNYPDFTARRVHVAQWVTGEKLSQSKADDVGALVNLGVITYLTQLLDTGFFHADPHPGNMLRTPDGKLVILDFGLMTRITDDQKFGMIEAIAHLIHRDYDEIGNDFVNLDFIPRGTDTRPLIPALSRVFDAALAGGGAKSINFQALASDLAEITFKFPFRIPPYFALIIRAISVLEGIALVGNPEFAIVDEAYPYISRRLLTDETPRLKQAFRYMVYGKSNNLDIDRIIDMLMAVEKFVAVKDQGDGSAYKVDGVRGSTFVGRAGDNEVTKKIEIPVNSLNDGVVGLVPGTGGSSTIVKASEATSANSDAITREAFKFFFSPEGYQIREFVLEEITNGFDALSRDALRELVLALGLKNLVPPVLRSLAPKLTPDDKKKVESITKLVNFLIRGELVSSLPTNALASRMWTTDLINAAQKPENQEKLLQLLPTIRKYSVPMREFGQKVVSRLVEKASSRLLRYASTAIFG